MPRHAPGDRVDGELHLHALGLEELRHLAHRVLGLRDGHPVARHDHDLRRVGHLHRGVRGRGRADGLVAVVAGAAARGHDAAEPARDDRRDRAVHRLRHEVRQDRAGRADDHARDDQRGVVQRDAGRGRRQAGERVEQRDHDRHVRAADRQHDQVARARAAATSSTIIRRLVVLPAAIATAHATAISEQREVHELLRAADRDRPARQQLLELGERDVRAPERDRADDRREQAEDRDVRRLARVAVRVAELRPRDQRDRAAADAVEQRDHLRHRGHPDVARGGDADRRPDRRCRG